MKAGQPALSGQQTRDAANGLLTIDAPTIVAALLEYFARRGMQPGPDVLFEGVGSPEVFKATLVVFWREPEPEVPEAEK